MLIVSEMSLDVALVRSCFRVGKWPYFCEPKWNVMSHVGKCDIDNSARTRDCGAVQSSLASQTLHPKSGSGQTLRVVLFALVP